jgi:Arc/MetJ-type ribon-helix-helix transcriptional regulator
MVADVASEKITVTIPKEQADALRALLASGGARSVSSLVKQGIDKILDADAAWEAELARMIEESGGPLSDAELAWADEQLRRRQPGH